MVAPKQPAISTLISQVGELSIALLIFTPDHVFRLIDDCRVLLDKIEKDYVVEEVNKVL